MKKPIWLHTRATAGASESRTSVITTREGTSPTTATAMFTRSTYSRPYAVQVPLP
jgi:hypothetical protein